MAAVYCDSNDQLNSVLRLTESNSAVEIPAWNRAVAGANPASLTGMEGRKPRIPTGNPDTESKEL